ncbi:acyl-CoA dehydrogenase [Niveispirillum sp. KHB5.9]|uniref:acyl-CoA dehydrogenase n=1 Tax=Niveispirillum sp. KHB5.9 TaxID=3400269 RepID=UPI003A87D8D7
MESVILCGSLLTQAGGVAADGLLSGIVTGEVRPVPAFGEKTSRHAVHDVTTRAQRQGDGWCLNGAKDVVVGAPHASHLLVTARTSGERRDRHGLSLFIVPTDHPGIERHNYRLIDERPAADLTFHDLDLPADSLLGSEGDALPLVELAHDTAIAGLCAEAVGIMRRMLTDTVDYTKQRRQFGQPLAGFQVLQHRMVDMYMALEQSISAAYLATLRLGADPVTRTRAVSAAKAVIGDSIRQIGQDAVQLHGAMGMTDELRLGHYFKRATVIEGQFGTVDHHVARYATTRAAG